MQAASPTREATMNQIKVTLDTRGSVSNLYLSGCKVNGDMLAYLRADPGIASRALVFLKKDGRTVYIQFASSEVTETDIAHAVYVHHQATRHSDTDSIVGRYDLHGLPKEARELVALVTMEQTLCEIG